MKRITALFVALLGCNSHQKGDWKDARGHYCDEVDLLQGEVSQALTTWADRFDKISGMPEKDQTDACVDAKSQLDKLSAMLIGFRRGAGALAYGRGEQSVEDSGLVLDFGGPKLASAITEIHCGPGNPYPAFAASLRTTKAELAKLFEGAVGGCTKTGWKSALSSGH